MGGGYDHVPAETLSVAEQDGPTLAVVISAHNAAVTISQHTAAWWINHTPSGVCTSVPAGGDISRTGLTKNTDYTFTAYSDNTCLTALTPSVTKTTLNPEADDQRRHGDNGDADTFRLGRNNGRPVALQACERDLLRRAERADGQRHRADPCHVLHLHGVQRTPRAARAKK